MFWLMVKKRKSPGAESAMKVKKENAFDACVNQELDCVLEHPVPAVQYTRDMLRQTIISCT